MSSLCSISSGNLMAFTSSTDLNDSSGKWSAFHVYVVDLNIAFTPYKYFLLITIINIIIISIGIKLNYN